MLINTDFINGKTIEEYKSLLKERLNDKRYIHSLCVADEAKRLAKLYGADENKAYFAGLLHDITKNATPPEHLQIFSAFGIILTDIELGSQKLWHAISGAAYVKHFLGIDDQDVIDAIRFHTTAKAAMTALETVLYLADFTSSDRDYEDVDIMREKVNKSADEALVYALEYTIRELLDKGAAVHPDTVAAYNFIVMKGKKK